MRRREKNLRQAKAIGDGARKGLTFMALSGEEDWRTAKDAEEKIRQAEWLLGASARRREKQQLPPELRSRRLSDHERLNAARQDLEVLADQAKNFSDIMRVRDQAQKSGLRREVVEGLWLRASRAEAIREENDENNCKRRLTHVRKPKFRYCACAWCLLHARGQVDKRGKVI